MRICRFPYSTTTGAKVSVYVGHCPFGSQQEVVVTLNESGGPGYAGAWGKEPYSKVTLSQLLEQATRSLRQHQGKTPMLSPDDLPLISQRILAEGASYIQAAEAKQAAIQAKKEKEVA
jgi:hypothetical protein